MIHHAGLLAMFVQGIWRGVVIEGASGAGKSDLTLRMIDAGWSLVADDRVLIWTSGNRLFGRAPDTLAGQIEARGQGVLAEAYRPFCRISLSVADGVPDRLPEPAFSVWMGHEIPRLNLRLLEASAVVKVTRAMWHLGVGAEDAYLGLRAGVNSPQSGGDSR